MSERGERLDAGPRAWVVCDLGFGDAGKGLVTDALVRATGARLVVRYNGGAQAGHNVVTPEGQHHTFAQLGAGSFLPGVRTFLSRHVVVHPTGLLREAAAFDALVGGRVLSRVGVSREARVITPYHQALNRLRELARGAGRHGSCGVGVGETVRDALEHPERVLRAGDLVEAARLRRLLAELRERLLETARSLAARCQEVGSVEAESAAQELALFTHREVPSRWAEQVRALVEAGCVVEDEVLGTWAGGERDVVFEGAQGVLLDEHIGFHPHTTWTDCTPRQALELCAKFLPRHHVRRVGVLRSHAVRHGPGPFPTEADLGVPVQDHNASNPWQGPVRYGWFDAVLGRYAIERCGGVDLLALTHLDLIDRRGGIEVVDSYSPALGHEAVFGKRWAPGAAGRRLGPTGTWTLGRQEELGAWLQVGVGPVLQRIPDAAAFLEWASAALGVSVVMTASGPTAAQASMKGT